MNTKRVKEIGKWMMVIGGTIFTAGAGTYFSARFVEKREESQIHKVKMARIEEEERIKNLELKKQESDAKAAKDRAYAEQLANLDREAFSKHHAENTARANQSVLDKAHRIEKEAEAKAVKTKLECTEEIERVRSECLRKIEEANKKRDEALKKYEAIDTLFTNKNEILKAKESLDAAVKANKNTKEEHDELLKNLEKLLS